MTTLKNYIQNLSSRLALIYPENEAKSVVLFFIEELLGISKNNILTNPDITINNDDLKKLDQKSKRLLSGEPVQYVTESSWFYGLNFYVNKHVLIPRQETEILVDFLIKRHKNSNTIKILDIGTGSGCIPICLKKYLPKAEIYAIDISEEALDICSRNAATNNVFINIAKCDVLADKKLPFNEKFDLIISNPPYVLESEKELMHKNVVDYEPELALYVDDSDPLIYYRHILSLIENYTSLNTELMFEINEKFANEIINLNQQNGFSRNQIIYDLENKQRFVFSEK